MPNWFPVVATRAVADQVVNESGYLTFTLAVPSASVFTSGNQRIVERKSLRTCTAGSCVVETSTGAGVAIGAIAESLLRPWTGNDLTCLLLIRPSIEMFDSAARTPPPAPAGPLAKRASALPAATS